MHSALYSAFSIRTGVSRSSFWSSSTTPSHHVFVGLGTWERLLSHEGVPIIPARCIEPVPLARGTARAAHAKGLRYAALLGRTSWTTCDPGRNSGGVVAGDLCKSRNH